MEIKGIGGYAPSVKPSAKPQAAPGAAEPSATGSTGVRNIPAPGAPGARPRVRAKDLLSEDEQRYMETLFPGATGETTAAETYAGAGRPGAVPPGSIVDRKG